MDDTKQRQTAAKPLCKGKHGTHPGENDSGVSRSGLSRRSQRTLTQKERHESRTLMKLNKPKVEAVKTETQGRP